MLKEKISEATKETNGILVYQEQFIRILISLGYTPDEANIIRKSIGKKHWDEVNDFKKSLLEKCGSNEEGCIDYLVSSMAQSHCEAHYKAFEQSANAYLDVITDEDDHILYTYQIGVIVRLLFNEDYREASCLNYDENMSLITEMIKAKYEFLLPELSKRVIKILTTSKIDKEKSTQLLFLEK